MMGGVLGLLMGAASEAPGFHRFDAAASTEAWRKKALFVANGRKFKASPLVVHSSEAESSGVLPTKVRSLSGTITLLD